MTLHNALYLRRSCTNFNMWKKVQVLQANTSKEAEKVKAELSQQRLCDHKNVSVRWVGGWESANSQMSVIQFQC